MIPGFEEGIVGMSIGEEKVVPLTFPDDYHAEELKGADVQFVITLKQVTEQVLPELDEQFLNKLGVADNDIDKFRADIRTNMQKELEAATKADLKNHVVDKLIETHKIDLPKALVANEIEVMRERMAMRFQGGRKSPDIDLKAMFPDETFSKEAERRVHFVLLVTEIAKSHEIVVDQERVKSTINSLAEGYEQPEAIVNHYYKNSQLLNQVQSSVLEEQVIEEVSKQAKVNTNKVGYFELVKHQ